VNPNEYRDFWVGCDSATGHVAAGYGNIPGEDIFMEFVDSNVMIPENMAVMTGWGSEGDWKFPPFDQGIMACDEVPEN